MLDFHCGAVLSSLIAGELARQRRISALHPLFHELGPATEFGQGALGTDSLDLLHLAGAVNEMFHLHETGTEEYLLRYRKLGDWCEIVRISLAAKAERLTFRTSGSTGVPKACVHLVADLQAEVAFHAQTLSSFRRILCAVPFHHIYGFLWGACLPNALSIPVLDVARWTPSRLAAELCPGDFVVGVPATWQLLSRFLHSVPPGAGGVTSGAPCPAPVWEDVLRRGVALREVYGSSETAGIGVRFGFDEPFHLLPRWDRTVPAPDVLKWQSDRSFFVGSRLDGAVQVAGHNVFPARIGAVLSQCPGVLACAVRPMRPEEGSRLKAFVVWDDASGKPPETLLREWLQACLTPQEMPAHFTFGPALPVNDMGKLADWFLPC